MTKTARRRPKQARSLATRDAIFEAAIQILEREGERAFNTNRIAERAGVSVGTIYQYFPNKEAILIAMSHAENDRLTAHNAQVGKARAPRDALRFAIRRFIAAFEGKPSTRRAVVKAVMANEPAAVLGAQIDRAAYRLPAALAGSRFDAFVLTRAVVGVVRAAVLEGYPGLHKPELEEALVRLVRGYQLGARRRRAAV